MGNTAITCDKCGVEVDQGEGPDASPIVWEHRPEEEDGSVHHVCAACYDPAVFPLHERSTVWAVVGRENARLLYEESR